MEFAREPVRDDDMKQLASGIKAVTQTSLSLTCVQSSSVDIPFDPHSGVAHRFDSGLEVLSSTLNLMGVA